MNIQHMIVYGLHGRSEEIALPIDDNKIIVVGVNGTGKTTILNILYYILTQQWRSLSNISFDAVQMVIDDSIYTVSKTEVESFIYDAARMRTRVPAGIVRRIDELRGTPAYFALMSGERLNSEMELELSSHLRVSPSTLRRVQIDLRGERAGSPQLFSEANNVVSLSEYLRKNLRSTILYLPTYRRIEKELSHIRHGSDITSVAPSAGSAKVESSSRGNYREMAEFGMADVEKLIARKCEVINRVESDEFKELISEYLSKVINNQVRNFDVSVINGLSQDDIGRVLNRVQDENLKPLERRQIQDTISRISQNPLSAEAEDIYVGQLFFGLMKMAERLQREEKPIHDFIKTVNENYLVDKELYYSRERRAIEIVGQNRRDGGSSKEVIKFSELSSGEKQIVSVFCHLYLGEAKSYFVLIDEPELSLSIDWQEHFLADIVSSDVCSFLFAVTHSPFTFSGELRHYRKEVGSVSTSWA